MKQKKGKVLVVDDNAGIRKALEMLLPLHFEAVRTLASPNQIVSSIGQFRPDVILLDMNFNTDINTGNEGLYWINEIKRMAPDIEVVLFTAYADVQLAVEGMKRGAFDFIVKPWDNDKLVTVLKSALDKSRKVTKPSAYTDTDMYWGESPRMLEIKHQLEKIAPTDATVLITGENGTGKDVLAREIHAASLRNGKPMVAVDAGAITETLFESCQRKPSPFSRYGSSSLIYRIPFMLSEVPE
jgi:DNA-binding NtrC family response regulator